MTKLQNFTKGILKENPILVSVLGLCPTLAITKSVENGFVKKEIDFTDNGETFHFEEYVRLIYFNDFKEIYETAGFELKNAFGNYNLADFNEKTSDRLILVLKK